MKVSYPLSLKVSVWLLLNLVLLTVASVGFFIVQGGLSWDALLAGPAGEHAQAKANVIAGEVSAAAAENRGAVLARFSAAYGADFLLVRGEETIVGTARLELPPPVRARTDIFRMMRRGGPSRGGDFGAGRGGDFSGRGADFGGPPGSESRRAPTSNDSETNPRRAPSASSELRRTEPGEADTPRRESGEWSPPRGEPFDPNRELLRGRFIVRTESPSAYWVGTRVPFGTLERMRVRGPGILVARVDSTWSLLRYLNLQSWLLAGTGVLVLSVAFWLPLVRSITRSIGQLTRATEEIAEGRFDTRINTQRRDELGKLGESVNRMASRLDAHMTGQKRFLGDVAHELCSPLARLQMATGILADQAPPNLKDTVADVRDEVQQMSTLVNELLAFTKAGLKPRDVAPVPVEVEPLVREVLAREDPGDRVSATVPANMRVLAEPELLKRALANLVRNAVRYAGSAGAITLTANHDGERVVLAVDDEGPGVPPAAVDRLGEPFFRPEEARTREAGGVGLGLAIVRNSIAACGGEVRFANRSPRGFHAEVRLAAA